MRLKVISLCSILVFIISICYPQTAIVTISGMVKDKAALSALPFVNVILKKEKDSAFVTGTVTNEEGRFTLSNIPPGNYILQFFYPFCCSPPPASTIPLLPEVALYPAATLLFQDPKKH